MRRFFCENCGTEVSETSDICPDCGAFFLAIKCPRCEYRGKSHEFRRGCPQCGYLGEATQVAETNERSQIDTSDADASDAPSRTRWNSRGSVYLRTPKKMPGWVFWLALGVLATSFFVLSRLYVAL